MTTKIKSGIPSYLEGLGTIDRPVVDKDAVKALRAQIRSEADPINKLRLLSQLEDEEAGTVPDRSGDEAVFVAEAKGWAHKEGIRASAFQALGVPDDVLGRAGFEVSGSRSAPKRGGPRAPRVDLSEVEAAAKGLGKAWKLADLAGKIGRNAPTTRNYLTKLIEAGAVEEVGDDPNHDGRGRAAKLYSVI